MSKSKYKTFTNAEPGVENYRRDVFEAGWTEEEAGQVWSPGKQGPRQDV